MSSPTWEESLRTLLISTLRIMTLCLARGLIPCGLGVQPPAAFMVILAVLASRWPGGPVPAPMMAGV